MKLNEIDTPALIMEIETAEKNIDTTTYLHDSYYVSRKGEIDIVLPVAAHGKFQ